MHIKDIRNDSGVNIEKYEPGANIFSKLGSHWEVGDGSNKENSGMVSQIAQR